jgi:hypothetical protein
MTATARTLAAVPRRLLSRRESALYCGCSVDVFDRDWAPFLRSVPKTLHERKRKGLNYDIRDLDALIERRKKPAQVTE